eukprot:COSAG05_NODE_1942_length_3800_cov_1.897595_7_plen_169_part_00
MPLCTSVLFISNRYLTISLLFKWANIFTIIFESNWTGIFLSLHDANDVLSGRRRRRNQISNIFESNRTGRFLSLFGSYRVLPMGASPSGPIFNEWVTRIFRRYNVLVGREQFAGLDDEFEAQVSAGKIANWKRVKSATNWRYSQVFRPERLKCQNACIHLSTHSHMTS